MFKKWLRAIIAEEVAKVKTSLAAEQSLLTSAISVHARATLNGVEAEFTRLASELKADVSFKTAEVEGFAKQIQEVCDSCIANFRERLEQTLEDVIKEEPSTWKAAPEDVKAEHQLRHATNKKRR